MSCKLAISLAVAGIAAALLVLFFWSSGVLERPSSAARGERDQPATVNGGFPPRLLDARPLLSRTQGSVELCGYGSVQLPEGQLYPAEVQADARRAIQVAAKSMALGSDDFRKAAGLYVSAISDAAAVAEEHRLRHLGCDAECSRQAVRAGFRSMASSVEQLAAHASASRDPGAYALAFYACGRMPESTVTGRCALVTAQQWSQLDPHNLIPWLYVASAAALEKDETARIAPITRGLQAKSSKLYWQAPVVLAEQPSLQSLGPATRMAVHVELMGMSSALPLPDPTPLVQYCSAKETGDLERRRQCSDVATVLTQRSTTVLEMSIGAGIGARAGWPRDRVDELRDRVAAYQEALFLSSDGGDSRDFWSCEFGKRMEVRLFDLARYGELGAARRAMKAAGKSESDLAQDWRVRMQVVSDKGRELATPTK